MSTLLVVPLKAPGARKSRLSPALAAPDREALAEALAKHVLHQLAALPDTRVLLLSPTRPAFWSGAWAADTADLNTSLATLRAAHPAETFAVINADLPLLAPPDITALLALAGEGHTALAPDHHGTGTNALALPPHRAPAFHFGPDSLARFRAEAGASARLLHRPGLARDIDTPEDLPTAAAFLAAPVRN